MTDPRHLVTLTVQIAFDGDYYQPDEMVRVATGWLDVGLEDRDDVTGWTVTGTVAEITTTERTGQ